MASLEDDPEPIRAEREVILRKVQRMPNLQLNDVLDGRNHFLPITVEIKPAMELLMSGETGVR